MSEHEARFWGLVVICLTAVVVALIIASSTPLVTLHVEAPNSYFACVEPPDA